MSQKNPGKEFLVRLLKTPETVTEQLDLIYEEEAKLCISRKKQGRGFTYAKNGNRIENKKQLARIKNLVIPPAWNDVRISASANAHLQAIGYDDNGRKQYL